MGNYRNRPKGNYIQEAEWHELYLLTECWQSDLEFYAKDIDFLEHLVDRYFIKLILHENLDEIREIQRDFSRLNYSYTDLVKRVNVHLHHLSGLIEDPFKYDSYVFRTEHEQLEDDILDYELTVRDIRKVVFDVTKDVLIHEKPKYIWKYN